MSMQWSIPKSIVQLRGLKITFQLIFKTLFKTKDKDKPEQLNKDPHVFLKDRNEQLKFEQKALEIDNFDNQEDQEVYKKIEKKKKNVK